MNTGQRFLLILTGIFILASCGGGGGSSDGAGGGSGVGGGGTTPPVTQQPPVTTITGSVTSVTDVAIALNASSGATSIAWTSNGTKAGDVSVRVNGTNVSTQPASPAGGLSVQVGSGNVKVEILDASGKVLGEKMSIASCGMGQWQSGLCAPYRYARLDMVVESVRVMPFHALKDGVAIPLTNRTGYTDGAAYPLGNCGFYDKILEDGRPLASCTTIATGNQRRTFPINPATLELMAEYNRPLPAGTILVEIPYGTYGDSPHNAFNVSLKGMYLDVPGYGTYYHTNFDDKYVRLTRDGFKTNTIVLQSLGLKVFFSFSNP